MSKVFTDEELKQIAVATDVILGCVDMGGLAPYQEDILRRRTYQILNIIKNGGKRVDE